MAQTKIAIITGGASGIGLATTKAIASRPDWKVYILDANKAAGEAVASSIGSKVAFIPVDLTIYDSQAQCFKKIFQAEKRIDFVYANAGIAERGTFYQTFDTGIEPPPEPPEMKLLIDILVNGAECTAYLARHYFRLSPANADRNIVITSSCGGFYPSYYSPIYTSGKHAILGFMRAIAPIYYDSDKIRVNAVCPGTVKTNLLSKSEWSQFPEEYFTPVEKIVQAVLILCDGKDDTDKGKDIGLMNGKAIECSGKNHYYREPVEYCDEAMRAVMASTERTN
ncbi:NAD(P)-binding protein [Microthyrium microscopicum]|uniref:NAD(P)-binding protein n=1 Tax=Microthyrium microscopicum TaxID=703497 RepID=A0A6A6U195_9PEZI|nr:NAD(P)-binding protein [Microthyrium microscopicum]